VGRFHSRLVSSKARSLQDRVEPVAWGRVDASINQECERLWRRYGAGARLARPAAVWTGVPATAEIDRRVLKANDLSECRIVVSILFHGASSGGDCQPVMLSEAAKAVTELTGRKDQHNSPIFGSENTSRL
jgi:hypothetical protein